MSFLGGLGGFFGSEEAVNALQNTQNQVNGLAGNITPWQNNLTPFVTGGSSAYGTLTGGLGIGSNWGASTTPAAPTTTSTTTGLGGFGSSGGVATPPVAPTGVTASASGQPGGNALGQLWGSGGNFGSSSFNANNIGQSFTASPGYHFAVGQAEAGANNSGAARGDLLSGNTAMADQSVASQLANQNYYQYLSSQYQGLGQFYNSLLGTGSLMTGASGQGINAGESQLNAETAVTQSEMGATAQLGAAQAQAQSSGIGSLFSGIGSLFGL